MEKKLKIGLALGGGSARGFAHVGVLKVLEEAGIKVDYLSGCSMGALVGAFYASGARIQLLERFTRAIDRRNWVDLTFSKMGLISGNRIEQIIYLMTRRSTFDMLKIPLAIVAVDLYSGKKIVLKEGLVSKAVRASISIPGYFVPVELDGMLLVDGGVLDRVPCEAVRDLGADLVIAVDTGFYEARGKINSMIDVMGRSFDIMGREISRTILINADFVIRPDLECIAPSQFDKAKEAIALGEKAARDALPELLDMLERRGVLA
jgi:NTE family protein